MNRLDEDATVGLYTLAQVSETGQIFTHEDTVSIDKPDLKIKVRIILLVFSYHLIKHYAATELKILRRDQLFWYVLLGLCESIVQPRNWRC